MPRPPAVHNNAIVDAGACARAGTLIERSFSGAELPRLREAGVQSASHIAARFQFSLFEEHPAIDGEVTGTLVTTCQRCMGAVLVPLSERFQVVVAADERSDELGGYEPIVSDPARLDLRWLAEEEALLALPLVPAHEAEACAQAEAPTQAAADAGDDGGGRQTPFRNLRDMLRQR
jgi:uncharacterized protein